MRKEIETLIFSKNRACQLELLLRSLNIPAVVLYTCDSEFERGYEKLIGMYPEVEFILQTDFKIQVMDFVRRGEYVLFLTDDDVMVEDFVEFDGFGDDVVSMSLALHPRFGNKWEWKEHHGSKWLVRLWGYPMSIGSCIFKSKDILPIIENDDVPNPNHLERILNANIPDKPFMMCADAMKIVNNAANQVQTEFHCNVSGVTAEELEELFLNGGRISLEDIKEKAKVAKSYRLVTEYKYEN